MYKLHYKKKKQNGGSRMDYQLESCSKIGVQAQG